MNNFQRFFSWRGLVVLLIGSYLVVLLLPEFDTTEPVSVAALTTPQPSGSPSSISSVPVQETATGQNGLFEIVLAKINSPLFIAIASVSTVLGLILTVYFYLRSKLRRFLVYEIEPFCTQIVKFGLGGELTVSFAGREVHTDVTAKQIILWNVGSLPVREAEILEPAKLVCSGEVAILEATIEAVSRDLVHAKLQTGEISTGKLGVEWKILERGDGIRIQIIYAGDANVDIIAEGVFEGQNKIAPPRQRLSRLRTFSEPIIASIIGLIASLLTSSYFATKDYSGTWSFIRKEDYSHVGFLSINYGFSFRFPVVAYFVLVPAFVVLVARILLANRIAAPPLNLRQKRQGSNQ